MAFDLCIVLHAILPLIPKEVFVGVNVFENQIFDIWLNKKSEEILTKMNKEQITTEDMLVLSLHQMNVDLREEFKKVDNRFSNIDNRFSSIDKCFEQVDKCFEQVDKRFEQVDKRFDRLTTIMMWQGGILATLISGLYLKLFYMQ